MKRALIAFTLIATALLSCETEDTAVEKGCTKDEECPLPDRQKCKVELGICVGHTTTPGNIDGGGVTPDATPDT